MSQLASLFQAIDIRQQIPPLIIGERSNPTGSKKFRELLLSDNFDGCLQVGMEQERQGAHVIDLSSGWAGRNEKEDLVRLVRMYSKTIKAPLMIDSTSPEVIEAALAAYPGRPIVNSINLEDGGKTLEKVCLLAKKYGACVAALTIDEQGMAMTSDKKVEIAKRIYTLVTQKYGLAPGDILFDPLTFTVCSGDEKLRTAAIQTLEAIQTIKKELPGCHTVLGLSNISFGLPAPARKALNAVFLHQAVDHGLDAVIIDPTNCIPLEQVQEKTRKLAMDLLSNTSDDGESPLMKFINHFETIETTEDDDKQEQIEPEVQLQNRVLNGDKNNIGDIIQILLDRYQPLEIVNQILVPAMGKVGELFGSGRMLLPFVLQSAEVMRASVDHLEPFMDKNQKNNSPTVLLATVQGDVHDIGKNLVNIILSNNGYDVIDIGIKVEAETIIHAAKEKNVDIICLSGLLVKSAIIMQESMEIYRQAGLSQPILLGGAALTREFVATDCVPHYDGKVVYCKDAFDGLRAIQEFEKGTLQSTTWDVVSNKREKKVKYTEIQPAKSIPQPPFWGIRQISVEPGDFLDQMKAGTLFRGRWGYTKGSMSTQEYEDLLETTVRPELKAIREQVFSENLFKPQAMYGWLPCVREKESLIVTHEDKQFTFPFPRQKSAPGLSLVDFFNTEEQGRDLIGFFLVTMGHAISKATEQLYKTDNYHQYLLLHGYGVQAAETLASYCHAKMRKEISIDSGNRYSFGYSACPDLNLQQPLFELLGADKIGVELSPSMQMVPEQSVSAMVVHHSQASYFAV